MSVVLVTPGGAEFGGHDTDRGRMTPSAKPHRVMFECIGVFGLLIFEKGQASLWQVGLNISLLSRAQGSLKTINHREDNR